MKEDFGFLFWFLMTNIGEIHYHQENKTNGGKQIEFSAESTNLKKKSKVGINEMFSNCKDSYRPVIIGLVQYQHSSVQLVLKKWIDIPS